jgi:hypothetical protein
MWSGFDSDFRKDLATIREMVSLTHQSPTQEWPLVFVEDLDALLVVREWPGGNVTAYVVSECSRDREGDATQ